MKLLILKEVESVNNTIVIHQPNFLPRMKVFIKIAISDIWVIYDNVQYVRREWQNRVFLRDSEQRPVLFTAPIEKADYFEKINNIKLKDTRSLNEHLYKHFQCNYSKAPYNKWVLDYLELLIKETYNIFDLASYNVSCMNIAFDLLGFKPEEKYSSKMGIDSTDRNGKLIELCIKSNCTNYVCGSGGKTYIDEDVFCVINRGIAVNLLRAEIELSDKIKVIISDEIFIVSRRCKKEFMEKYIESDLKYTRIK